MRPIPIPDELELLPGTVRKVIAPPGGDLLHETIRPVEALIGLDEDKGAIFTMLIALEPGDLERLTTMEQPAVWLSVWTNQLAPFSVEVADGQG